MGPLQGVKIVEMDAIGPVPLAGMMLADMGAEVVRIARPGGQSAYEDLGEAILHRGRKRVELNLKDPQARDQALALITRADAVVEGYRPGVMEKLGLGPEIFRARAPRLVYGRMTGWGQTGPFATRAGHDINYIAVAGALGAMTPAGETPHPPLNLVGDYGGGAMLLVQGVLAALLQAGRSGQGQVVDAAMTDGVGLLLTMFQAMRQAGSWGPMPGSNLLDGGAPFYGCYLCRDGRHVAVGALEPQFFKALLAGLGLEAAAFAQYDRAEWPRLKKALAAAFATRDRDDWAAQFAATDACVSPVLSLEEAVHHPQSAAREGYRSLGGLQHPAPAPRFSATPSEIRPESLATVADILRAWDHPPV